MGGYLPVGGSGDTGMLKAGAEGNAGRRTLFRRPVVIIKVIVMIMAYGAMLFCVRGFVKCFMCVIEFTLTTVCKKSAISSTFYR